MDNRAQFILHIRARFCSQDAGVTETSGYRCDLPLWLVRLSSRRKQFQIDKSSRDVRIELLTYI